jgi:hypothetical protein
MKCVINNLLAFIGILLFGSCTSDIDTNQVDDFAANPAFTANIASFNFTNLDMLDTSGNEITTVDVEDGFDFFQNDFFDTTLESAAFYFEIDNTLSRGFTVDFSLIDNSSTVIHTFSISVPAYTGANNLTTTIEIFNGSQINLLKNTKRVGVQIQTSGGATITSSTIGHVNFKSSLTAYLSI